MLFFRERESRKKKLEKITKFPKIIYIKLLNVHKK